MSEVDYNDLKPLKIAKSKGTFKIFTNGSIVSESKIQPYLGKAISINKNEILSVYPSEDDIGTQIHSIHGQTWKVLEEHDIVVKRLNETDK
tara:strand:+ start:234 stop:506 length:273 start_codon:yes stop_codon:yes gene_type:complete